MKKYIKKFISLFISSVMLFNLTADIFAAPQLASKEQLNQITDVLNEAYTNSSSPAVPSKKELTSLEKNYNKTFNTFATLFNRYNELDDIVAQIIAREKIEQQFVDELSQKMQDYEEKSQNYNEQIKQLGGKQNIEKEYALYQQWLELKPEIDQRKAELEEIIEKKENAKEVKTAKKELEDYNNNFYSYQEKFDLLNQNIKTLEEQEEYLKQKANSLERLFSEEENIAEFSKLLKKEFIKNLSSAINLNEYSSWNDFLDLLEKELNEQLEKLNIAQTAFENAEKKYEDAKNADLENRLETSFLQAMQRYCNAANNEAQKYTKEIPYGKINGHKVEIEPGSVRRNEKIKMTTPSTIKPDLLPMTKYQYSSELTALPAVKTAFQKQKQAYLTCTNPVWDEELLKKYNAGITMEELAELKYGEYLLKYSLKEGKNLSEEEMDSIAEQLAKTNIALVVLDPILALGYFYTLIGDYNQSIKLKKYFWQSWKDNYGIFLNTFFSVDEDGIENNVTFTLSPTNEEGDILRDYYISLIVNFSNTQRITTKYFHKLSNLYTEMISYLADENINKHIGTATLQKFLDQKGISLSQDFFKQQNKDYNWVEIDEKTINAKIASLTKTYTEQERNDITEQTIKKRPFDILMFCLGPSHAIDRKRTYKREKEAMRQGFELNFSKDIKDILFFNSLLQQPSTLYKNNLAAWNNLAFSAFHNTAHQLLQGMAILGHTMNHEYEEKPKEYSQKIEDSYHEPILDLLFDLFVGFLLANLESITSVLAQTLKTTTRVLVKNSIKVTLKSNLKQGLQVFAKRSLLLTKIGIKKSAKNLFKPRPAQISTRSMRNATRTDINSFKKQTLNFKSRFSDGHTLGRKFGSQETLIPKFIRNIKNKYTIRPTAVNNSQIVKKAALTKEQYKILSKDLDAFYMAQRVQRKETATISKTHSLREEKSIFPNTESNISPHAVETKNLLSDIRNKVTSALITIIIPSSYRTLAQKFFKRTATEALEQTGKKAVSKDLAIEVKQEAKQIITEGADNAWIFDRPNNSAIIPENEKVTIPERPTTEGGSSPNPNLEGNSATHARSHAQTTRETPVTQNPLRRNQYPRITSDKAAERFTPNTPNNNPSMLTYSKTGKEIDGVVKANEQNKIITKHSEQGVNDLIAETNSMQSNIYNWAETRGVDAKANIYYTYRDIEARGQIYETKEAAQQAKNAGTLTRQNDETILSDVTPPYPGMKQLEIRMAIKKLAANMSNLPKYYSIGRRGSIEHLHTHGLSQLGDYFQNFMEGKVVAVMQKTKREWLVVYEKTSTKEVNKEVDKYVIGIIQENPDRGVNLLVTNYGVELKLEQLGEQFLKVQKFGEKNTMRKILGTNKNNIVYLNKNGGKEFLKDVDNIFKDVKIGDTYTGWTP